MNQEEIQNQILSFLKKHTLSVVSTVDIEGNKTESAVVAFAEKDNLELIFGTSNTTRKYKNLQKNKNVSFVIGWSGDVGTVQYEGVACELSKEESPEYSAILLTKNPFAKKFTEREDQRFFLIKPTWIRIHDMSKKPDEIFEINLN